MIRIRILLGLLISTQLSLCLRGQEKYVLPPERSHSQVHIDKGIISCRYDITHFYYTIVSKTDGDYLDISLPGVYYSAIVGQPKLPVFSKLAEIQSDAEYKLKITYIDSLQINLNEVFPGKKLMPVKPSARKTNINLQISGLDNNSTSKGELLISSSQIQLEIEGKMRGISLGRLQYNPYKYDVEHNSLIVYYSIQFTLTPSTYSGGNMQKLRSVPFIKSMQAIEPDDSGNSKKRLLSEEPITMLVLSDTIFRNELQPFIEWKTSKGFRIFEVYKSDSAVGKTNTSIKAYLSSFYNSPPEGSAPPTYLLIVGDIEHVPPSKSTGQVTDLYYTTFDGEDDYLPEMFHGRISVKTRKELTNVINKVLMYEKYMFPDPSFLNKSILIAGRDDTYALTHGNGQINYAAQYYFNEANNIHASVYLHPDAYKSDRLIYNEISQGASFVNYTGHGDEDGWIDPELRIRNIDTLKNTYKYSFMLGNGCRTNQFNLSSGDCFAEAIVKVKNAGAIAYIGCTNDSYWDEDYYWSVGVGPVTSNPTYEETTFGFYDELFHQGNEAIDDWAPSLGEMIFAGNMAVQQSTSSKKQYYWEIYQLMGDPSLVPWFSVPDETDVSFPKSIPVRARSIGVSASPYDYIAVSGNKKLISAKHADRFGQAALVFPDTLHESELILVVTGDRRQPFMDTIYRNSINQEYLEIERYSISDESKDEDGILTEGESFSLDLHLINKGKSDIRSPGLFLSCKEDFITITDSVAFINKTKIGDTIKLHNAFRINIAKKVDDLSSFNLSLKRENKSVKNTLFLKETIHSPEIFSNGIYWDDREYGNGNGIIEPGEKILFTWDIVNRGSYRVDSLIAEKGRISDSLFSDFYSIRHGQIQPGKSGKCMFIATVNQKIHPPIERNIHFLIDDGVQVTHDSIFLAIGRHFEEFSSGDLNNFNWINSSIPWHPDSLEYLFQPYSLRSGKIPHDFNSIIGIDIHVQREDSIRFNYKVSSEQSYDFLQFRVDSILIEEWSGYIGWDNYSFLLDSGDHTISWSYIKDENTSRGEDAAWIDNILFPVNSFISNDLSVLKIINPGNGKDIGSNESVRVLIGNTGEKAMHGLQLGYRLDGAQWIETETDEILQPGEKREFQFSEKVDMSVLRKYELELGIKNEADQYPGNDSLKTTFEHYIFPDLAIESGGVDSLSPYILKLLVDLRNNGNVEIDKWHYTYFLNDILKEKGIKTIHLKPGETLQTTILLASTEDSLLINGIQQFKIISEPDSMLSNNSIEGIFYWKTLKVEKYTEKNVEVYPNPIKDNFYISLTESNSFLIAEFYGVDGKLLSTSDLNHFNTVFNAKRVFQNEGIYFICIKSREGRLLSTFKVTYAK